MGMHSVNMQEIKVTEKDTESSECAVTLKNIDFLYNKNTPILSKINLEIKKGSVVGLVGKNGVGKSTLMDIICGLPRQKKRRAVFW